MGTTKYRCAIGSSNQLAHSVDWYVDCFDSDTGYWDSWGSGGYGLAESRQPQTAPKWLAAARRHCPALRGVPTKALDLTMRGDDLIITWEV
jgi:hypothetical protein